MTEKVKTYLQIEFTKSVKVEKKDIMEHVNINESQLDDSLTYLRDVEAMIITDECVKQIFKNVLFLYQ